MRGHSGVTPTIKFAGTELDIYLVQERLCMCELSVLACERNTETFASARAV